MNEPNQRELNAAEQEIFEKLMVEAAMLKQGMMKLTVNTNGVTATAWVKAPEPVIDRPADQRELAPRTTSKMNAEQYKARIGAQDRAEAGNVKTWSDRNPQSATAQLRQMAERRGIKWDGLTRTQLMVAIMGGRK